VPDSIADLPNLGPKSCEMLQQAGILTATELRRVGAVEAYILVQRSGAEPTLNLLWALEGALRDVPWQEIAGAERRRLLDELHAKRSHR